LRNAILKKQLFCKKDAKAKREGRGKKPIAERQKGESKRYSETVGRVLTATALMNRKRKEEFLVGGSLRKDGDRDGGKRKTKKAQICA